MIQKSISYPPNETNEERLEKIRTSKLSKFEKGDDGSYEYFPDKKIDAEYEFHLLSSEMYLYKGGLNPNDRDLEEGEEKDFEVLQAELGDLDAKLTSIMNWFTENQIKLPKAIIKLNDPNNKWHWIVGEYEKRIGNYVEEQKKISEKELSDFEKKFSQKEDWNGTIYGLADELRELKKQGKCESYREAYENGEKNWTVNGKPVNAEQLERSFNKGIADGKI